MGKLTDTKCRNAGEGKHADGGGLYLHVTAKGRYWRAAYRFDGKQKTASFGVYPATALKDARLAHAAFKAQLKAGIDPNAHKKEAKAAAREDACLADGTSLRILANLAADWLNEKQDCAPATLKRHGLILKNHILPAFGQRHSETITALEVRDHIRQIAETRRETASKTLALIKEILRHGVTIGLLQYNVARELTAPTVAANPMRHLLTPEDIGAALLAIERLPAFPLVHAYLRLLPYLVLRPDELAGLEWREIEGDTIRKGKEAMKMRREHLCPIPTQAQVILGSLRPLTGHTAHVFHNATTGRPITTAAALNAMKRHGINTTSHGWRHTFSTLMNGRGYDRDHIEKQLSHTDKNNIRDTYNHADYLDQRRTMLQAWADWLDDLKRQALARECH
jgi:integrase family protein